MSRMRPSGNLSIPDAPDNRSHETPLSIERYRPPRLVTLDGGVPGRNGVLAKMIPGSSVDGVMAVMKRLSRSSTCCQVSPPFLERNIPAALPPKPELLVRPVPARSTNLLSAVEIVRAC